MLALVQGTASLGRAQRQRQTRTVQRESTFHFNLLPWHARRSCCEGSFPCLAGSTTKVQQVAAKTRLRTRQKHYLTDDHVRKVPFLRSVVFFQQGVSWCVTGLPPTQHAIVNVVQYGVTCNRLHRNAGSSGTLVLAVVR